MSSSKSSDIFLLVKSMSKSEKRAFKLFARRNGGSQLLFLKLFDLVDKLDEIDDLLIMKKLKLDSASKYSNLKRHLYSQILSSLRMINIDKTLSVKIHELIDKSYILYEKGLTMQALNLFGQAKQLCKKYGDFFSLLTIIEIEKKIHSRHITRQAKNEFDQLLLESTGVSKSITKQIHLTNLKMNLHHFYIQEGHVRNQKQLEKMSTMFKKQMKDVIYDDLETLEKIVACQCFV